MKAGAQVAEAIAILDDILYAWSVGERVPADGVMARHYKQHRYIGSKDRQIISGHIFFVLRHKLQLEWWLEKLGCPITAKSLVLLTLSFKDKMDLSGIISLFSGKDYSPPKLMPEEQKAIHLVQGEPITHEEQSLMVRRNCPLWLEPYLQETFGENIVEELLALEQEAPLDLRVNTLKTSRDKVLHVLENMGLSPIATPHSPLGIRLNKREPIMTTALFQQGQIEIQDEGSQMLAACVRAEAGQKVIDFCAGAGGKTLAIAALMQNKGRVLALDTHEKRLAQMQKRLARAGVNNVTTRAITSEQDSFLKRHYDSADWVLVDAPCSGTGTWRRNPDSKWRMDARDLLEIIEKQRSILQQASKLVKLNGYLVYATCSLLEVENKHQVDSFLQNNPHFALSDPSSVVPNAIVNMTPNSHQTDGFFAAIMQRIA